MTVKAVRYYHSVGVRDQAERTANGYKQCGVPHLVRVLQIKRLSELGVPLGGAVEVLHAEEQPSTALRAVDAETRAISPALLAQYGPITRVRSRPPDSRVGEG